SPPVVSDITRDPCIPSPCGMFSECRDIGGVPSCSCLPTYRGSPPNCKPECTINAECPANMACMQQRCKDPCPGLCGIMAECSVVNHVPICSCLPDYTGDPFIGCSVKPLIVAPSKPDPCTPSPCGPNTQCNGGICNCIAEYFGDPYSGCRPECVLNNDCPNTRACVRNKCVDPCPGVCGQNAICNVYNHVPMCTCPSGMDGNAFVLCSPVPGIL
ncbi:PREDICTED: neurogenic locus notch homolog protein 4-like, partial [Cyphomyrmex costatus]|uniref:neurogenic locus notch homolog protein 4-like n=1 Tax=Cyphomyrmex costatus TaxID=456900 RepID=UPI000852207D